MPIGPGRSPSWSRSSAPERAPRPTAARSTRFRRSEQRELVDAYRLAYIAEAPVNWCPGLGTVLANEEVTADGRSERGNFPVYKRPLKQWMMRITAYADRLLADLDQLDWSDSIKLMQRNWIGRSTGALARFPVDGHDGVEIEVFTTRPDTLFGATYMVLAPEHPLVDVITANEWPGDVIVSDWSSAALDAWKGIFGATGTPAEAVSNYRKFAGVKSELERQSEGREKTGVFTGAFAINPTNDARIPIFIADYVLMGYGTGAIMAVPAHDHRDFEFAREFELAIVPVIRPSDDWLTEHDAQPDDTTTWPEAYVGDGAAMNSANAEVSLDGLRVDDAKRVIAEWLAGRDGGEPTVTYKLRDWLFSRQRYWGEPFPIVYDEIGPVALPESLLPVELPEITDFEPATSDDPDALPQPPLARAADWVEVELDLPGDAWAGYGAGKRVYLRETNTMPQWAGSCWYYLRYLDPTNEDALVDPAVEREWAQGVRKDGSPKAGLVDLYVGGVEHAVLHLLYARFWHKVFYDLGHVSTIEPFQRLVNQGMVLAAAYTDERGMYVEAVDVVERDGGFFHDDKPVTREFGKMGKSIKNAVTPDVIFDEYGADTLRLYEMFTGPLDASRPWNTADIIGVHRFLQRVWRNVIDEKTGDARVSDSAPDDETQRVLQRTIAAVRDDMATMSFNTAIARLTECNNHLTRVVARDGAAPREVVEPLVLMCAPLVPHIAEELWARLGHPDTLTYESFPSADESWLVEETVEIPGAGERQGAHPREGSGRRGRRRARTHRPRRSPHRGAARRRHRPQSRRGPRPPRQLRNRLIAPISRREGRVRSLSLPPCAFPLLLRARRRSWPIHSTFRVRSRRGHPTSRIACARCGATRVSASQSSRALPSPRGSRGSAPESRRRPRHRGRRPRAPGRRGTPPPRRGRPRVSRRPPRAVPSSSMLSARYARRASSACPRVLASLTRSGPPVARVLAPISRG